MKSQFKISTAAALFLLTACGSGSDGLSYDSVVGQFDRASEASPADASELSGQANMTGVIVVEDDSQFGTAMAGDMTVQANFDTGEMTGTASNIGEYQLEGNFDSDGECISGCGVDLVQELGGSLDLDATISGNTFNGDLTGEVTGTASDDDGNSLGAFTADVDLNVDGGFLEDDEGLMAGADLDGSADLSVDGSVEVLTLEGGFVVAE